jgi:hypothetical protein
VLRYCMLDVQCSILNCLVCLGCCCGLNEMKNPVQLSVNVQAKVPGFCIHYPYLQYRKIALQPFIKFCSLFFYVDLTYKYRYWYKYTGMSTEMVFIFICCMHAINIRFPISIVGTLKKQRFKEFS